jgi:uncharacterized protein with NRDE domain
MCLIAFAIDASPVCPLLIAANRDEFLDRPTEALHRWTLPDGTGVVAGRDLRDGGTWLGVSETGRVAMITNVRSAQAGPGQRSRGELATRWLDGGLTWEALLDGIDPAAYGGFNLVVGDFHNKFWAWAGNRDPERPHDERPTGLHSRRLEAGVYGLSNAALDTPWPKSERLKQALGGCLAQPVSSPLPIASLTAALADARRVPAHELPQTGVPLEMEHGLSSPFVSMPERGYGTRSSMVLSVQRFDTSAAPAAWRVAVDEWTHAPAAGRGHAWNPHNRRSETLYW